MHGWIMYTKLSVKSSSIFWKCSQKVVLSKNFKIKTFCPTSKTFCPVSFCLVSFCSVSFCPVSFCPSFEKNICLHMWRVGGGWRESGY